jgi:hypothetical protein
LDTLLALLTWERLLWAFPVALFNLLFFASPYGKIHLNAVLRNRWMEKLRENEIKGTYRKIVTPVLDRLDAALSPIEIADKSGPLKTAYSIRLLNILMLLAVAYPILSVTFQWITGSPILFGGQILEPSAPKIARIFVGLWLAGSIFLYLCAAFSKPPWRVPLFIGATVVLLGGLFLSESFSVPKDIAFAFAVAGAFAVAFAFAFAVAGAVAGAFAFAFAGVGAVAVTAFAIRTRNIIPITIFIAAMLLIQSLVIHYFWQPDSEKTAVYIMLFFGIFPIFNLTADFASVGLTRYLLRKGLNGLTWLQAFWDALGGIIIFFTLGGALITYIHVVQTPNGPLLNLRGLFNDLETRPHDMWWLGFMLVSTLIPTFLHLMLGTLTILLQYPAPLRKWVIARLVASGQGIETEGWQGSLVICAMITAAIWVPCLVLYAIFSANHGWLLQGVIAIFKAYYQFIGRGIA